MTIKCPHCAHSRSVTEGKIPPTAEYAKCPKCGHRFRFRTLEKQSNPEPIQAKPERISTAQLKETHGDIWDAVESLHQKWDKQLDTNVAYLPPAHEHNQQPTEHSISHSDQASLAAQTQIQESISSATPKNSASSTESTSVQYEHSVNPANFPEQNNASSKHVTEIPTSIVKVAQHHSASLNEEGSSAEQPLHQPVEKSEQMTNASATVANKSINITASPSAPTLLLTQQGQQEVFEEPDELPILQGTQIPVWQRKSISPEEKVEQTLSMLMEKSDRQVRDLGQLAEHSGEAAPWNEDTPLSYANRTGNTPEFLREIALNIRGVVFFSQQAWHKTKQQSSPIPIFLFAIVQCILAIMLTISWLPKFETHLVFFEKQASASYSAIFALAPIVSGSWLLFSAAIMRTAANLFGRRSLAFSPVLKTISAATTPFILGLIPFYGFFAGLAWSSVALAQSCLRLHKLNFFTTLVLTILWIAALFLGLCLLFLSLGFGFIPES